MSTQKRYTKTVWWLWDLIYISLLPFLFKMIIFENHLSIICHSIPIHTPNWCKCTNCNRRISNWHRSTCEFTGSVYLDLSICVLCHWPLWISRIYTFLRMIRIKKTSYFALFRSTLEYGDIVWDPHLSTDIGKLEIIQKRAGRFISSEYKSRDPGCVSNMLQNFNIPPLQQRRKELRLIFLFKVAEGSIPAIPPQHYYEEQEKHQSQNFQGFWLKKHCRSILGEQHERLPSFIWKVRSIQKLLLQ